MHKKDNWDAAVNSFQIPANRESDSGSLGLDDHCSPDDRSTTSGLNNAQTLRGMVVLLPRDPLPLAEDLEIDPKIRKRLLMTPDYVEEARRECVLQFLENILLPRMWDSKPLTGIELARVTVQFKERFQQGYPPDLITDFELLPAVDQMLMELYIRAKIRQQGSELWREIAALVDRTAHELDRLFEHNFDELIDI